MLVGTVRADESAESTVESIERAPCGSGTCTTGVDKTDSACLGCNKSLAAVDKPCKYTTDDNECAGCDKKFSKSGKSCGTGAASCGSCTENCVAGATAITFDEGVLKASALSFNFLPATAGTIDVALSSPQELLRQKLAQRDQLQQEIDELCETTQSWQQVVVHVKVMEVSLTKMRELGIDFPGVGSKSTGAGQVSHAYTPACECPGGECSTEKCSFESCDAGKCGAEKCSAEKRSPEKCSKETCSAAKCSWGTCAAGKCKGEKCSADGDLAEKCSKEKCSEEACCDGQCAGEACSDGVCYDAAVSCETCSCECESQNLAALLETLQENNVARVLADPTLVTVSGRPASFHVGGELPVPAGPGSPSACDFIDFGTKLDVLAVALGDNKVRLEVRPRVSTVCDQRSLDVAGGRIPSLEVTQVDTACELEFGQSTVLTGLVQRRVEAVETEDGVRETANDVMLMVVVTPEAVESTARRATVTK